MALIDVAILSLEAFSVRNALVHVSSKSLFQWQESLEYCNEYRRMQFQ